MPKGSTDATAGGKHYLLRENIAMENFFIFRGTCDDGESAKKCCRLAVVLGRVAYEKKVRF